ncbi:LacI family DNA-binding transcriptional regulator [Lachnoclostridium sp. Marseille-P6806]|uniref:LacI family DNA-binding transcriptional regulator n=1 Tax=Lachnoclostridium sp. Marseille-P6806 TaxID=2364793 RepID=UPI001032218E|nr:LacI family DNA-binding transcriptional regulator [Lachnoclostridium sp. Marseille-P6806]
MVTIKEIARECGVSPATVSNILNGKKNVGEETRRRVMEVVKARGYRPNIIAQGLRNQKTRTIGIIAEDFTQFSVPAIIDGAMAECEHFGYRTTVQNLRLYSRWKGSWFYNARMVSSVLGPAIRELETIMVDGIIYIAGHGRRFEVPQVEGMPIVLTYAYPDGGETPYTVIDDRQGAFDITRYLIERGHRRIGVIAGAMDNLHTQLRLQGHQEALFEAGALYDPTLIVCSDWEKTGGYAECAALLSRGVTAIFCMNDRMAGGVYQYCHEHGIMVGRDISVAGFDNELISEYQYPELTTMEIPLFRFGTTAVRQLISLMEPDKPFALGEEQRALGDTEIGDGLGIRLRCRLIERKSVVKPAG